jgi:hypothetical protein
MEMRHILKTTVGIDLEFFLHPETFRMRVAWKPAPPASKKRLKKVMLDYLPWRDAIVQEAAMKAGKRILIFTPKRGKLNARVFGPAKEVAA